MNQQSPFLLEDLSVIIPEKKLDKNQYEEGKINDAQEQLQNEMFFDGLSSN